MELPALFEPGDNHPYGKTLEARARKEVAQLMPGELHDMSCLLAPADGVRPPSVLGAASGGG